MGQTVRARVGSGRRWRRGALADHSLAVAGLGRKPALKSRPAMAQSASPQLYLSPSLISLVTGPILTKEEGWKGWVSRKREAARCVSVVYVAYTDLLVTPKLGSGI